MRVEGLYKAEWYEKNGKPYVFLYCRKKNRKKVVRRIPFSPYFLIPEKEKTVNNPYVLRVEKTKKVSLDGKKLFKAYVRKPTDVYNARNFYKQTYESDVMFVNRFLIDEVEEITPGKLRLVYFDIETTAENGFPDYKNPQEKVISISFYDNFINKYFSLLLRPKNVEVKDFTKDKWKVKVFDDEQKMLLFFFNILKKVDFDILLAWNIQFDASYLFKRAQRLRINVKKFFDVKTFKIDKEQNVRMSGKVFFDLLTAFKRLYPSELQSYSLDYVAKEVLGNETGKIPLLHIDDTWKNNPDLLVKYNMWDVNLAVEIDKKVKIVDYWYEVQRLAHLPSIDMCFAFSMVLDNVILRKFKNKFGFPNKNRNVEHHQIAGGFVRKPPRGVFDWIYVFDFSAMYPSIIKTFNLSNDTISQKNKGDYCINNIWWYSENIKKGILPQVLDDLLSLRKKYKDKMKKFPVGSPEYELYNMKQTCVKFLVNSTYGITAFPSFRLYDFRVADTITYIGRTIARYVSDRLLEETNYKVLYNDTDSVFVQVGFEDLEEAKKIEKLLNNFTAEKVKELSSGKANNYMRIEVDKIFDKVLFCEKKHYVGRMIYKGYKKIKPRYKYVGVDIKRNNIPEILRTALKDVVETIFNNESNLLNVVKENITKIEKSNDVSLFKIPTKINKVYKTNVPQQRAANFANKKWKLGLRVGSKFYSIWVKHSETDIIGFDVDERVKEYIKYLDKNKYIEAFLQKVELLYDINTKSMFTPKITSWF